MFCWPCCVMLAGTALYIHLLVYEGLSLFIISGLYVYMVVCVVYAYNLTKVDGCHLFVCEVIPLYLIPGTQWCCL